MAKRASLSIAAGPFAVFEARLETGGGVRRVRQVLIDEAVGLRRSGHEVVVCGSDLRLNRRLAREIEHAANGRWKRCDPHSIAGPDALPHYQPEQRGPVGHILLRLRTAKLTGEGMEFFTPDLYMRGNSEDDAVLDEVETEWENRIRQYRSLLRRLQRSLPESARKVAKLCLHDAELIHPKPGVVPVPPMGVLVVGAEFSQERTTAHILLYSLAGKPTVTSPRPARPFAKKKVCWLYDELDYGKKEGTFVHRILFSDGRVMVLPFDNAAVESLKLDASTLTTLPLKSA